ncbi:MAG TPA: hypothetical protein VFV95_17505 [Vicinamibacterales bacterium]|nr:hypothetical protein [Vicinamibacterales bacterium]
MEVGFSTPLLEMFQRGEVPREVRLIAAQGELALRAHERIALLVLLAGDADAEVASAADATLRALPDAEVAGWLARSDVPERIRAFFAARGVEPASGAGEDGPSGEPGGDAEDDNGGSEGSEDGKEQQSLVQRIAAMTVAQRVVRAMKGTREERAILIRDPNKLVSIGVLSSPKLTETEVESIAKMANVSEDVLRIIGRTRAWMKTYTVAVSLAKNPKTPVATSMNILPRLMDKDLRMISIDRNVPEVLRIAARRKLLAE